MVSDLGRNFEHVSIVDLVGYAFGLSDGCVLEGVLVRIVHYQQVFANPL